MVSSRYAGVTTIALALALVPTAIHTYVGAEAVDDLITAAIPTVLADTPSSPTGRKASWAQDKFASEDWIERVYRSSREEVLLFVARSYDAKRLYHHPELAILRGTTTEPAGVLRATARPDVPLHLLTTSRDGRRGVAAYALAYAGRFIESPITFQFRTAAENLLRPRKPVTLFLASDLSGSPDALEDAPAIRILLAAIGTFESQSANQPLH